ncbi:STAS domain-containing protein [Quadrisphaera sp. KR29]|uniref:STAS domain-containing protein n=1 Tax=Quadrisphaera sp. KR29 TaxID=3461391 RepID=UPI0040444BB5
MGTAPTDDDAVEEVFGSVELADGDPTTLVLSGEVDLSVTQGVRPEAERWEAVERVDLSGTTFLDSSGMRLLVQVARRVAPRRVRVVGAGGQPLAALEMFGADQVVDLEPAPSAASEQERPTGT